MKQVFIRRKLDGVIKGPLEADFAFQQLNNNTSFNMYSVSIDQKNWQEAQVFFQSYIDKEPKKTKQFTVHQKMPNNQFGKYQILSELGRGGMGVVYLVYDPEFERKCALKVLLFNRDKRAHQRFAIEARAMARFKNKNIVQIYDIKEHPKQYFVMEYIEGHSFDKMLEKSRLTLNEKLDIFCQICDGVAYAHREKVIHRDLKPENIIISKDNIPKILDFGIAKQVAKEIEITKTGELVGTPKYLSPELIRGEKSSYKSDLYALAVILYEILTGKTPFEGSSVVELMYAIASKNPLTPSEINPEIGFELDLLCMKCLDKDPEHRLESVAFLRKEIGRLLKNKPILTRESSYLYKAKKWVQRHRLLTVATLSLMSFLLAVIITLWISLSVSGKRFEMATKEREKAKKDLYLARTNLQNTYLKSAQIFIDEALFHKALKQVNKVYEIQEKQPQKEYFKKANFLLRYSVLPSLPKIKIYKNELGHSATFSPNRTYIYLKDQKNLYIWKQKIAEHEGMKATNSYMKVLLLDSQVKVWFTEDANFFIVYGKNYIETYHLATKKKISLLKFQENIANVSLSNDAKYLAFVKSRSFNESELFLYHLPSKKIKKLFQIAYNAKSLAFSKNNKWLVYIGSNKTRKFNYISYIFHVKTGQKFQDENIARPTIKFSRNNETVYINNRAWLSLQEDALQKFQRLEDNSVIHNEIDKDYLILDTKRIYQEKNSEIIQYDEISKTKTKFNLSIPEVKFDLSQNFLIATSYSSVALWSINSAKMCYVYHAEKNKRKQNFIPQNLNFIPRSNIFYTNTLNNKELIAFHPFPNTKSIDFLSQEMMDDSKILQIQRDKNNVSKIIVDSSNTIFNVLVKRVKNKEGIFSNISIYNDHPVVCKNGFIALLAKGCLIIYDRKNQKRYFIILPASKFIAIEINGDCLYYVKRQYGKEGIIGKITLSKLKNATAKDVVGYEERLFNNGHLKTQICFIKDKIFISAKNSIIVLDKNLKNQKIIETQNFAAMSVRNKKLYIVAQEYMEVFKLKNSKLVSLKNSKTNIDGRTYRIAISGSGKYIAIASGIKEKRIFLGKIDNNQILELRPIHFGNINQLLFHPQKDILAIFDTRNIIIHDCVTANQAIYQSGLFQGRIATFDPKWHTFITEISNSIGLSIFDMTLKKSDYEYFFKNNTALPSRIFDD